MWSRATEVRTTLITYFYTDYSDEKIFIKISTGKNSASNCGRDSTDVGSPSITRPYTVHFQCAAPYQNQLSDGPLHSRETREQKPASTPHTEALYDRQNKGVVDRLFLSLHLDHVIGAENASAASELSGGAVANRLGDKAAGGN